MNNEEIKKLLTLEEIKKLRTLYSHYLDSNNMDGLLSLFTKEAICQTDRETWRGHEEIKQGLSLAFIEFDKEKRGSYPFLHAVTNQWVEITGIDIAQGRCYLIDFATARTPEENALLLLGIYADEYKFIGGKWYIDRSRLDLIWPKRNGGGGYPGKSLVLPQ
jgi:hypothetical protein